jgi:hypothetical protein
VRAFRISVAAAGADAYEINCSERTATFPPPYDTSAVGVPGGMEIVSHAFVVSGFCAVGWRVNPLGTSDAGTKSASRSASEEFTRDFAASTLRTVVVVVAGATVVVVVSLGGSARFALELQAPRSNTAVNAHTWIPRMRRIVVVAR